ncbi:hypothetical protein, partial [Escherichia coli]|uniref:hypothetical protein n=1 Tax=Escherichia coli TaxID=562 RepID=UPI001954E6CA
LSWSVSPAPPVYASAFSSWPAPASMHCSWYLASAALICVVRLPALHGGPRDARTRQPLDAGHGAGVRRLAE